MSENNSIVRISLIVIGVAILASILWNVYRPQPNTEVVTPVTTETDTTKDNSKDATLLCYYRSDKTKSGAYDKAWLAMSVSDNNKVTGEFHDLPAEKDAKSGEFTGTVEAATANTVSRLATLWWTAAAEGTTNTEELLVAYDANTAKAAYGEMMQSGDKTYVYKDKSALTYGTPMNKIDCNSLNEMIVVEKYIPDNITKIATDTAVLGGTWRVTSIVVDPATHTADIAYEDGHVSSKAHVEYTFSMQDGNKVTVTKFTPVK